MNPAAFQQAPLALPGWRSRAVSLLLLAVFCMLAGRAAYLQGLNHGFLQQKGESRYGRVIELFATRGMITDRNGEPLAISTPVESVWASPADVDITPEQMKRLAQLLETDAGEIKRRPVDTTDTTSDEKSDETQAKALLQG